MKKKVIATFLMVTLFAGATLAPQAEARHRKHHPKTHTKIIHHGKQKTVVYKTRAPHRRRHHDYYRTRSIDLAIASMMLPILYTSMYNTKYSNKCNICTRNDYHSRRLPSYKVVKYYN